MIRLLCTQLSCIKQRNTSFNFGVRGGLPFSSLFTWLTDVCRLMIYVHLLRKRNVSKKKEESILGNITFSLIVSIKGGGGVVAKILKRK